MFHTRCPKNRGVLVKCCTQNFFAYTDFKKLERTLLGTYCNTIVDYLESAWKDDKIAARPVVIWIRLCICESASFCQCVSVSVCKCICVGVLNPHRYAIITNPVCSIPSVQEPVCHQYIEDLS